MYIKTLLAIGTTVKIVVIFSLLRHTTREGLELAPAPRPLSLHAFLTNRGYTELPVKTGSHSNWLYMIGDINKLRTAFIVDTGTVKNYYDETILDRESDTRPPPMPIPIMAQFNKHIQGEDLFNPLRFTQNATTTADKIGAKCGLIGMETLVNRRISIDYKYDAAYIKAGAIPVVDSISLLRILDQDDRVQCSIITGKTWKLWYLRITIGKVVATCLLDSGSVSNLLFTKTLKKLGLQPNDRQGHVPGVNGRTHGFYGVATLQCEVNNSVSSTMPFCVCDTSDELRDLEKVDCVSIDGILGASFLQQSGSLLILDSNELYLSRRTAQRDELIIGRWSAPRVQPVKDAILSKLSSADSIKIDYNTIVVTKNGKQSSYHIAVYPWKSPKRLSITSKEDGSCAHCIYEASRDTIRLSYASHSAQVSGKSLSKVYDCSITLQKK